MSGTSRLRIKLNEHQNLIWFVGLFQDRGNDYYHSSNNIRRFPKRRKKKNEMPISSLPRSHNNNIKHHIPNWSNREKIRFCENGQTCGSNAYSTKGNKQHQMTIISKLLNCLI